MHAPSISTPLMRIGLKKTAIVSLVAMTTATALLIGCKGKTQNADEAIAAGIKESQATLSGKLIIGTTTANLSKTGTTLTVGPVAAAKISSGIGPSGMLLLTSMAASEDKIVSTTVKYTSVNATAGTLTISATEKDFPIGSLVQPADVGAYALKVLSNTAKGQTAAASPSEKAVLYMAAGNAEVLATNALFHKIDAAQDRLEHALDEVADLTARAQANNRDIAALLAKDPTKTLETIDKNTKAATTGEQGIWNPGDSSPIPALETVEASIKDLDSKIAALKASRDDLDQKKKAADTQAEQLRTKSEATQGKESYELYKQASNLRKDSANFSTKMQDIDAKVVGFEREKTVATARKTQLDATLDEFKTQTKDANDTWVVVKNRVADVVNQTKMLVNGDAATAPPPSTNPSVPNAIISIAGAGVEVAAASDELDKLRADAKAHLENADKYFEDAAKNDKTAAMVPSNAKENTFHDLPEHTAWEWQVEINSEADPTLARAEVQGRLARLHADAVYYTTSRKEIETALQDTLSPKDARVKAALDDAKLEIPKSLDPSALQADIDGAKASADTAFKNAENDLKKILGSASDPGYIGPGTGDVGKAIKDDARIASMVEQYCRAAYCKLIGDKDADTYLNESAKQRGELAKDNIPLPQPLPADIAPPPPTALASGSGATSTPGPASQPAETPAANPAANDTPEQAAVRTLELNFASALFAGDAVTAKTYLIPDPKNEANVDATVAFVNSFKKVLAAGQAKFAAQPAATTTITFLQNLLITGPQTAASRSLIAVDGDSATVKESAADLDPGLAKKVDGAWKIAPTPPTAGRAAQIASMQKATTGFDALTADMDSGKMTDMTQFVTALQKVIQDSGLANPDGTIAPTAAPAAPATAPPTSAPAVPDATTPAAPATPPAAPATPAAAPATPAAAPDAPAPPAATPATPAPATPTPPPAAPK